MAGRPWEVGDERQRWDGYLDPDYDGRERRDYLLRNLFKNVRTPTELSDRERDVTTSAAATLHAHGLPRSFDLEGLKSIHRHLFEKVYPWAGELRTVNMGKGSSLFTPPEQIERGVANAAEFIRDNGAFIGASQKRAAQGLASVYMKVNEAHPFREGNGRTQREFLKALAAESGHRLEWGAAMGEPNNVASRLARDPVRPNPEPMYRLFEQITVVADPNSPSAQRRQAGDGDRFRDRWEELTPDQQQFLTRASRVSQPDGQIDLRHVAAISDTTPQATANLRDQLTGSRLLENAGGQLRFTNPDLVRFIRHRQNVDALPLEALQARTQAGNAMPSSPRRSGPRPQHSYDAARYQPRTYGNDPSHGYDTGR